jgi:hypothetical protein
LVPDSYSRIGAGFLVCDHCFSVFTASRDPEGVLDVRLDEERTLDLQGLACQIGDRLEDIVQGWRPLIIDSDDSTDHGEGSIFRGPVH